MDGCSEAYNMTDCLLQSVLDGIKDHNKWDLPSLCVTVVIGVVAAGFGFVTVIQGILAPGRRKCSNDAIGDWSQITKHHFNLSELRWDSVAKTPVLTSSVIQPTLNSFGIVPMARRITVSDEKSRNLGKEHHEDLPIATGLPHFGQRAPRDVLSPKLGEEEDNSSFPATWRHFFTHLGLRTLFSNEVSKKNDKPMFSATWLRLFTHIGVQQIVWNNLKESTKSTSADYLPSDVQAVPAYMDIDTIVVLAAAAGCYRLTIEPQSGCPVLTGTNVGVRFRRDPFLGLVASFEYYGNDESDLENNRRNLQKESHKKPEEALVNFHYSESEPFKIQFISGVVEPYIAGPALNADFSGKNSRGKTFCPHGGKLKLCRCWRLLIDLGKRYNFSWLLCADPRDQKGIFPAKTANVEGVLSTIVVQGSYWRRNHLSDKWILDGLKNDGWNGFWQDAGKDKHSLKSFEPFALCLKFATDVGAGQRLFLSLPQYQRTNLRCRIQKEMIKIDEVIESHGTLKRSFNPDTSSQCIQVEIYIRAAALMLLEPLEESIIKDLHKASSVFPDRATKSKNISTPRNILKLLKAIDIKEGEPLIQLYDLFLQLFNDCWAAEVDILIQSLSTLTSTIALDGTRSMAESDDERKGLNDYTDQFGFISFMMEQEDPMRELLIYRTILLAVICLTALDNSAVVDSGIGNQIVPFL